jgi:hypothetical protein
MKKRRRRLNSKPIKLALKSQPLRSRAQTLEISLHVLHKGEKLVTAAAGEWH